MNTRKTCGGMTHIVTESLLSGNSITTSIWKSEEHFSPVDEFANEFCDGPHSVIWRPMHRRERMSPIVRSDSKVRSDYSVVADTPFGNYGEPFLASAFRAKKCRHPTNARRTTR